MAGKAICNGGGLDRYSFLKQHKTMKRRLSLLPCRRNGGALLLLLVFIAVSCRNTDQNSKAIEQQYIEAINAIFERDEEIGIARNHTCEDTSLTVAIRQYLMAMDNNLDFSGCPPDFTAAFREHREAWAATIPFFEQYDTLRGEMHELFAVIKHLEQGRQRVLDSLHQQITLTWDKVEQSAREHGALKRDGMNR